MTLPKYAFLAVLPFAVLAADRAYAACMKPNMPPEILDKLGFDGKGYQHDRWGTEPYEIKAKYDGFVVSFDSADDDNGDGVPDVLGVPAFVAHQVKKHEGTNGEAQCIEKRPPPQRWCTHRELVRQGIAPADLSYVYSRAWRRSHPDWFVRGQLAMKFLVERVGQGTKYSGDAAWNTHTMLNAVPQRASFKNGIWLDLEHITGRWAQRYGNIWIVTGPIFADGHPIGVIGTGSTKKVAIPDALFKIVIRENNENRDEPHVLAFIYPQVGPGYTLGPRGYRHARFITSVDEIEKRTGLDFLTVLSREAELKVEAAIGETLWDHGPQDDVKSCRDRERVPAKPKQTD